MSTFVVIGLDAADIGRRLRHEGVDKLVERELELRGRRLGSFDIFQLCRGETF